MQRWTGLALPVAAEAVLIIFGCLSQGASHDQERLAPH